MTRIRCMKRSALHDRRARLLLGFVLVAGMGLVPLRVDRQIARGEEAVSDESPAGVRVDAAGKPLPANEYQWGRKLTRQQFLVLRQKATEQAFSGRYWKWKAPAFIGARVVARNYSLRKINSSPNVAGPASRSRWMPNC